MFKKITWGALFIALITIGCAGEGKQIYHSNPAMQTVSTSHYEVTLEPLRAEGYSYYNQFRGTFTNKTDGDLAIDWSETYYLQNGKRYGRFGWVGMTFEELRGLKEEPDTIVAAGKTITQVIFPLKLIGWKEEGVSLKANTPEAGFTNGVIPAGENGMSIAVLKDGKVLRKQILVTIIQE
jgi:hypothetical protein